MSWLPLLVRRATHASQMELDAALAQMYALCTSPSLVRRLSRARKLTKNRYERDDPAFVVLQVAFLIVSVAAQGALLRAGLWRTLTVALYRVLVDYALCGVAVATLTWLLVRRVCATSTTTTAAAPTMAATLTSRSDGDEAVTWAYAFDVHCNAYFVYFAWTQLLGFVVVPLMMPSPRSYRVLGNTLCACGEVAYVYNVFLGYLDLPSLQHQQRLLYPVPCIVVCSLALTALTWCSELPCSVNYIWN